MIVLGTRNTGNMREVSCYLMRIEFSFKKKKTILEIGINNSCKKLQIQNLIVVKSLNYTGKKRLAS